jgi:hypothetical protein
MRQASRQIGRALPCSQIERMTGSWVAADLSFTVNGQDPFGSPGWNESLLTV